MREVPAPPEPRSVCVVNQYLLSVYEADGKVCEDLAWRCTGPGLTPVKV